MRAVTDTGIAAFGVELERRRSLMRPKLSANEAARRVGMTGQWWRAIERGNGGTTRAGVIRMATVVHWDPDDAVRLAGFEDPVTDEERQLPPPDPRDRIDHAWPRMTDEWREQLARIAELAADPHAVDRLRLEALGEPREERFRGGPKGVPSDDPDRRGSRQV